MMLHVANGMKTSKATIGVVPGACKCAVRLNKEEAATTLAHACFGLSENSKKKTRHTQVSGRDNKAPRQPSPVTVNLTKEGRSWQLLTMMTPP